MSVEAGRTPRVLSIAGSDSGGGAGIQADLKAFARCGVHGMTAITAITAQNTVGVQLVEELPVELILAQVRAVQSDIGVDAVKVGMLASARIVRAVAQALDELGPGTPVVVDPVMVSETGATLLAEDARGALIEELLPRASVITPNLPEARALAGPDCEELTAAQLAHALLALGPRTVVITGGHREQVEDLYLEAGLAAALAIVGERHPAGATHGSGCTHSSILAAQLALGHSPLEAARSARALAGEAVAHGLRDVGEGPGPVDVLGLARIRASARGPARGSEEARAHLP